MKRQIFARALRNIKIPAHALNASAIFPVCADLLTKTESSPSYPSNQKSLLVRKTTNLVF
jgi:hypothetical protein